MVLYGSMASMLFACGCSKESRGRHSLDVSIKASGQAKDCIIDHDYRSAERWADKAKVYADKAQVLPENHPFHKKTDEQLNLSQLLAGSFDDPESSVKLWWDSIGKDDTKLALAIFDVHRTIGDIVPSGSKPLEDAFTGSLMKLYSQYLQTVSTMSLRTSVPKNDGSGPNDPKEAIVDCSLTLPNGLVKGANFSIYLYLDDNIWRLYDMSTQFYTGNNTRATEAMRDYAKDASVDELLKKFDGKNLMDVFGSLDKLREQSAFLRADRGLVGSYVTLLEPAVLKRGKEEVPYGVGTYLTVISCGEIGGEPSVVVCTNHANDKDKAYGEVKRSLVEDKGNDESNLWGTSSR